MPEITMAEWIVRSLVDYAPGQENSLASKLAFLFSCDADV
jgi:hypothetical protein